MPGTIRCSVPSAAIYGRGLATAWSFRQAQHRMAGPCHLDGRPDLTNQDGILRDDMDGRGSTSNP